MILIDDFKKVEIRAGKIISAEKVEKSEKLLKLSVDFGTDIRQVISGIAKYIKPEELVGITCAFVTNLEPKEIMELTSEAMIMAVSGDLPGSSETGEFFSLLKIEGNVPPGSIVK